MNKKKLITYIITGLAGVSILTGCDRINISEVKEQLGQVDALIESDPDMTDEELEEILENSFQDILAEYGLYDESSEMAETSEEESNALAETEEDSNETFLSLDDIPDYSGKSYYVVNDNRPYFDKIAQLRLDESYSELDDLGRCGMAFAKVSRDTMPERGEKRGEIGMIKPTGWHTVKYDCVDGNYLYNRCHLIGWQLGAENANEKNLVTGTRYMNLQMLEYENMVADYIYEGGEYVLYRVTPVYLKDELLCRGLLLEGLSDDETVSFNVFFYNVQPGIVIDYSTGENYYDGVFLDKTGDGVIYNE